MAPTIGGPISGTYISTLFGKRVFVEVMGVKDLEMGRLSWIIWVGPK